MTTEATPVIDTATGTLPAASTSTETQLWQADDQGVMSLPVTLVDNAMPLGQAGNPAYDGAVGYLAELGMPAADVAALQSGRPLTVTRATYETDLAMKNRLLRDPTFRTNYLAGGQRELQAMLAIQLRLTARIVD